MTTHILDPKTTPELQPAHGLWNLYDPNHAPFAFHATDRATAQAWQAATRPELSRTIGFEALPPAPLEAQVLERIDKGSYIREKILLRTWRDALMPVYLLLPKRPTRPLPLVLALHGHGYGVKDIVGLWEDGRERRFSHGYHKDFGVQLCKRGFVVAAPEISCFGERQSDFSYLDPAFGQEIPTTCAHTAFLASHLGGTVLGLRVREGQRLLDYLQTRPEILPDQIGAMGISGGGMHTFFSTCLDERIRACVVSGYFCTFRQSILAMQHCPCNFVPGLGRFGEESDLVGLIAPRPMLIEAADRDPIFPIQGVRDSVEIARARYALFGAQDQLETDYFQGTHQVSGQRAYDFLAEKLHLGK